MTTDFFADPASLVRPGAVHRAVYMDPALFALEQARIFRRVWLYVGHESEVPNAGDFVVTRLGADEVVLVRQADGSLALLHNRCAHRGARVVSDGAGNVRQFRCPYHSWAYRIDGTLIGVPDRDGYGPSFDPADPKLGLQRVSSVASYRGFIFGSHATDPPPLASYLGGLASAIDNLVDRAPAGTVTRFGGRLQMEYAGNWKLFMENAVDLVHPGFVHSSSVDAARAEPAAAEADAITGQAAQMFLANGLGVPNWDQLPVHGFPGGHVFMGGFYRDGVIAPERDKGADPVFDRYRAALVDRHGEEKTRAILAVDRFNNLIWPNVSINARFQVMRVLTPVAVDRTIVTAYCFRLDGAPEEMAQLTLRFLNTAASPASMVASDDLEIFERCQRGFLDSGSDWLDISRGLARDQRAAGGEMHAPGTSELPIRTQLAAWQALMAQPQP